MTATTVNNFATKIHEAYEIGDWKKILLIATRTYLNNNSFKSQFGKLFKPAAPVHEKICQNIIDADNNSGQIKALQTFFSLVNYLLTRCELDEFTKSVIDILQTCYTNQYGDYTDKIMDFNTVYDHFLKSKNTGGFYRTKFIEITTSLEAMLTMEIDKFGLPTNNVNQIVDELTKKFARLENKPIEEPTIVYRSRSSSNASSGSSSSDESYSPRGFCYSG